MKSLGVTGLVINSVSEFRIVRAASIVSKQLGISCRGLLLLRIFTEREKSDPPPVHSSRRNLQPVILQIRNTGRDSRNVRTCRSRLLDDLAIEGS